MVSTLVGMISYTDAPKKFDLDLMSSATMLAWPSIEKPPVLELKSLPSHLRCTFLGANIILSVIIAIDLLNTQVEASISVL